MTASERKRCVEQIRRMPTRALKEMGRMMEWKSKTESETLTLIHEELQSRGYTPEDIPLGIEDAERPPAEERPR